MVHLPAAPDLPPMPAALAERHGVAALRLRPFGASARDLEVDLRAGDRPGVVTEVLRACSEAADGEEAPEALLWELPVGLRLQALVALCARSGAEAVERAAVCSAAGCHEPVTLALPLAELLAAAGPHQAPVVEHGGERLRLRLPTGDDLRRWAEEAPSDAALLAELAEAPLPAAPSADLVAKAEEALAEADPLVDLRVEAPCPACGSRLEIAVDLETEAVALLDRAQQALLAEVAFLARAFHWSEAEILALPAWRRRRYLELAAQEAS